MTLEALLFDVDGTLAETEELHRQAFNAAFAGAGLDWHWDREHYGELLAVAGGRERIAHYIATSQPELLSRPDLASWIAALHADKTRRFAALVKAGALSLRSGVARLLREARAAGLRLAIATTTSRANVHALLEATPPPRALNWFEVIGTGEDAAAKKPDPEIYISVLARLALEPCDCLAIEDSANGLRAALGAGLLSIITPSAYTVEEDFSGAVVVVSELGGPGHPFRLIRGTAHGKVCVDVELLRQWHASGLGSD